MLRQPHMAMCQSAHAQEKVPNSPRLSKMPCQNHKGHSENINFIIEE